LLYFNFQNILIAPLLRRIVCIIIVNSIELQRECYKSVRENSFNYVEAAYKKRKHSICERYDVSDTDDNETRYNFAPVFR